MRTLPTKVLTGPYCFALHRLFLVGNIINSFVYSFKIFIISFSFDFAVLRSKMCSGTFQESMWPYQNLDDDVNKFTRMVDLIDKSGNCWFSNVCTIMLVVLYLTNVKFQRVNSSAERYSQLPMSSTLAGVRTTLLVLFREDAIPMRELDARELFLFLAPDTDM